MANPLHNICDVDVNVMIGGRTIPGVVSVSLSAPANGIPEATILIDATHTGQGRPDVDVKDASTSEAIDSYRQYKSMLDSGDTVVSIHIGVDYNTGMPRQRLSVSGWPLTDVSLTPIAVGACPGITLVCKHPLIKASWGGALPPCPLNYPVFHDVSMTDPLTTLAACLTKCIGVRFDTNLRSVDVAGAASPAQIVDALKSRFSEALGYLQSHAHWEGGNFKIGKILPTVVGSSFGSYASPDESSSILQRMTSYVIPECSLTLGGDYTKNSLVLKPFTPWAKPRLFALETDVEQLHLPSKDPSPLSGVRTLSFDARNGANVSFHVDTAQKEVKPIIEYYVPSSEIGAPHLYGPIVNLSCPTWLSAVYASALKICETSQTIPAAAGAGKCQTAANFNIEGSVKTSSGGSGDPPKDLSELTITTAKAFFETSLMRDYAFMARLRFMPNDFGGSIIAPGGTFGIRAVTTNGDMASPGDIMVRGNITSVTHEIDIRSQSASTTVGMSHPVFGEQLPRQIQEGDAEKNALYT